MTAFLREELAARSFDAPQVIYGGSVNAENAASLMGESDVDGFSWRRQFKAEVFYTILRACDDCYAVKR